MKDFNDVWKDSWVGTTSGEWDNDFRNMVDVFWVLFSADIFVGVLRIFFSWMKADIKKTTCRNENVT